MFSLPTVIRVIVLNYHDGIDLLKILYECRWPGENYCEETKNLVNQTIRKRIVNSLKIHYPMLDAKVFLQKLMESRAVISGSFLIHCIYPQVEFSDVDIFVGPTAEKDEMWKETEEEKKAWIDPDYKCSPRLKSKNPICTYLRGATKFNRPSRAKSIVTYDWMLKPKYRIGKLEFDVAPQIKHVESFRNEYECDRKYLQVVHCRCEPKIFVQDSSDFRCCKWTFDGENVEISDESIISLINKTIEIIPHTDSRMDSEVRRIVQYYRWQKYTKKGFMARTDTIKQSDKILLRGKLNVCITGHFAGKLDYKNRKRPEIDKKLLSVVPWQTIEFMD